MSETRDGEVLALQIGRPLRAHSCVLRRCNLDLPIVAEVPPLLDSGEPLHSGGVLRDGQPPCLQRGVRVDVVFEPKVSTWQNRRRAELHVKDVKLASQSDSTTEAQRFTEANRG